jgi:putative peptide zinc metalloprotease protein
LVSACFPAGAHVAVGPFVTRRDGESVMLADPGRGVFVSIPQEGLEILRVLAGGGTVGEAADAYERAHGETVDLEDFLSSLADRGLVARWEGARDPSALAPTRSPAVPVVPDGRARVGRLLFGGRALVAYVVLISLGVALVVSDPGVIAGPRVLVFHHHVAVMLAILLTVALFAVLMHESAHLLAAWACGTPARIGLGRRLWFLVAETDLTGVWLAPKGSRYIAFLAGVMVDGVQVTILIAVVWAGRHGLLDWSPTVAQLLRAVVLGYLLRLLWQCFVFVRTDFYYVLATRLDCKRLLADTEDLLRNHLARLAGRPEPVDQTGIPAREMRAIRVYQFAWAAGHALALASLVSITIPVLVAYATDLTSAATGGHARRSTLTTLLGAGVGLALQGGGLLAWTISLARSRRPNPGGPPRHQAQRDSPTR